METWLLFDIMSHDGEDLEDFSKLALGLLSALACNDIMCCEQVTDQT